MHKNNVFPCDCLEVSCIPVYKPVPPPKYSSNFSLETASFCLGLVSNLYISVYEKEPLQEVPKASLIKLFSFRDIRGASDNIGALYIAGSNAYLVFRGTIGNTEFYYDFTYSQIPYGSEEGPPDCVNGNEVLVHKGFATLYNNISVEIKKTLQSYKFKNLYITGHSLGAALATLATYDLSSSYKTQSYVFASPRVGNMVFGTILKRKTKNFFNIQNDDDIVTHVPPSVIADFYDSTNVYFYSHVGEVYLFRENWLSFSLNHSLNIYAKNLSKKSSVLVKNK